MKEKKHDRQKNYYYQKTDFCAWWNSGSWWWTGRPGRTWLTNWPVYTWPTKKPMNILAIDDIMQMAMNDSIFELKLVPSVNLVLCLNVCFGLSCCSQEKFSDKSLMNYWFIFKWVVTNLIFRVKVYCQMWGNSSFKEKDNEHGGKSKAFAPNVQISYEELIIIIKKYVLWKKKTWEANKLLLSENWFLCLMKAFPTPNFWVHFVLKERKNSPWIQTHVKDCTMVVLKWISYVLNNLNPF